MPVQANRINFFSVPSEHELPTLHEYSKWRSIREDDMSPTQYMRFKLSENAMLSRNVVNALVIKMHQARINQLVKNGETNASDPNLNKINPAQFREEVVGVIDILRESDRNCIQKVSEYFLKHGYVERDVDGSIRRLFVLPSEFDAPKLEKKKLVNVTQYGPRQALGIMSTFLSNKKWKVQLVNESINGLIRGKPDTFTTNTFL